MAKKVAGLDLSGLVSIVADVNAVPMAGASNRIALDMIEPDPEQPRKIFSDDSLCELADSIRERGVLQPIVVTAKATNGKHRIIFGERRWRASKIAEKIDIPAVIRQEDADLFDQMIENIQREELSHSDIARMILDQIKKGVKARQIAKTLGKHESWVSRYKNFFDLPAIVRERIDDFGLITAQVLQRAYAEGAEATTIFMNANEDITRQMAEQFVKILSAPPENALIPDHSEAEGISTFDQNAVSPFSHESGESGEGRGEQSGGSGGRSESEADYGIGESKSAFSPKKAKYAALVSVKKKPGSLGHLLIDRLASKEEHAAISFDGEVIEFPVKEIKLVSISPVE